MTQDNLKRTLYRLDKGFSLTVLYKERTPIYLPSILIKSKERATERQLRPNQSLKDLYYTNNIAQVQRLKLYI